METKHQTFNLTFKEHPVFKENNVIVDGDNEVFLWINKETNEVSFGGKYFQYYEEQKLIESLHKFIAIADEFIDKVDNGLARSTHTYTKLKEATEFAENVLH